MKKIIRSTRLLIAVSLLALPVLLQAQPTAHYVPGVEGIKGASLPPPGFYVRDYNYAYFATQVNDAAGNSAGPGNFEAFTYANVPRAHLDHRYEVARGLHRRGCAAPAGLPGRASRRL